MSVDLLSYYLRFVVLSGFALLGITCSLMQHAHAQDQNTRCRPYELAVQSKTGSVAVIPDRLLVDWKTALPCLILVLGKLSPSGASDQFDSDTQNRFLSATSVIRAFINDARARDKKDDSTNNMVEFIKEFRELDNIDVTQALSFGLRQENGEIRSNALLILGEVIQNKTLCVPIDHIYDPRIETRGRANLLAVISVVAPWAYAENFDNICRMAGHVETSIVGDQALSQTKEILTNLRARADTQTDGTNQSVWLPNDIKQLCYRYKPRWAATSLLYENKRAYRPKCQTRQSR